MTFVLFLLSSLLRLSLVSVVFVFNASLNDVVPVSPMLFPVDLMRLKKSDLLMDFICMLFFLCSQLILSSVNVVFFFSISQNSLTYFENTVT